MLLFDDLTAAALNPDAELTAFLPRDGAFRRLVYQITGEWIRSEAEVFATVASTYSTCRIGVEEKHGYLRM